MPHPDLQSLINPHILSLHPYEPGKPIDDVARELGLDPRTIIKLASNENPLGPSPRAIEAMQAHIHQMHIYPDGGAYHLRQALAQKHNIPPDHIVLGNGSNEIIELAFHAFTAPNQNQNVIASRYAFVVYKLMAQLFNIPFIETPDRHLHHDLSAIYNAITPHTKLIFIANPNNPTGTRIPNDQLLSFIQSLPPHVILCLDEAYYEFLEDPLPSIDLVRQGYPIIVMRTFSKIQGLAGLRIGYGVCPPAIADALQRSRQPFNTNALAQAAALAALQDENHLHRTLDNNRQGRQLLEETFKAWQLPYLPTSANFVLVKTGNGAHTFQSLLKRGIIVRSMVPYGLPEWIRVTIGTPEQNQRFLENLKELLFNTHSRS
ncbi:MAG: histidinol-phosphate transaminase [Methylacidiphilales bacterium]|nr:histidinol-phosphate transaminase [Candidatus Methylacidiphilales bacterium]MDW8349282.1 histidinol-phosphate transaminase [Verrucomicrobiae bacterium]